jgi:hypothetical protein
MKRMNNESELLHKVEMLAGIINGVINRIKHMADTNHPNKNHFINLYFNEIDRHIKRQHELLTEVKNIRKLRGEGHQNS